MKSRLSKMATFLTFLIFCEQAFSQGAAHKVEIPGNMLQMSNNGVVVDLDEMLTNIAVDMAPTSYRINRVLVYATSNRENDTIKLTIDNAPATVMPIPVRRLLSNPPILIPSNSRSSQSNWVLEIAKSPNSLVRIAKVEVYVVNLGVDRGLYNLETIRCFADDSNREKRCPRSLPYEIGDAEITQGISGFPCVFGETWGFTTDYIWVKSGCRGMFRTLPRSNWYD